MFAFKVDLIEKIYCPDSSAVKLELISETQNDNYELYRHPETMLLFPYIIVFPSNSLKYDCFAVFYVFYSYYTIK